MGLGELEILGMTLKGQYAVLLAAVLCLLIFLAELQKFLKYKTRGDALEFSGIGFVFCLVLGATEDLLLAILLGIFVMMVLGSWEVRENVVWSRLMLSFTITYGFILAVYIAGIIVDDDRVFGIGWNLSFWVLLITSFIFFGRRFILVSRFLSPTYVYLFMYGIAYLALLQANLDWQLRYPLLFIVNVFLYMISGPLLRFLFGIRPLDDDRVNRIVDQVQKDVKTPIKHIGIVNAPILNAFAYGAWFDQRIAFIASDISKYSDEEIAGIAAHELAHLKGKHTLILLFIGFADLAFRFVADIPASYYDYAFREQSLGFLQYYLLNFALGIVALFFVRVLEGNADLRASKAGYGPQLAASLYRLEGYYRGVAGDLGLSSQLLTGQERTDFEENRFMGDAALDLHHTLVKAPRLRLLVNLIMSHPLSAFRIAAILNPEISPVKGALLPWLLMIPKLRNRWLRKLRATEDDFAALLTEKYQKDRGTVSDYSNLTPDLQWYNWWKGQTVCFRRRDSKSDFTSGVLEDIVPGEYITEPLRLKVQSETEGQQALPISDYEILFADVGTAYLLKNGRRTILEEVLSGKKGKPQFSYQTANNTLKKSYLGVRVEDLPKAGQVALLHSRGVTELVTITEANFHDGFKKSYLKFRTSTGNDEEILGRNLILSRPINFILISGKKHWERQRGIFEWTSRENIPLTIFDKDDLEIGRHCIVQNVGDDNIDIQVLGDDQFQTIPRERLDAIIPRAPLFLFYIRQELGIGTKIGMWLANRGKRAQFIL
ncbi:MAG: M48 family metallopeptidase [Candidatus Thorarchaeota archaeon]